MRRGTTLKYRTETTLMLERKMVTHHDVLTWDLERCVGCQIGPLVCPKDALTHVDAVLENGRMVKKQSIDVDPQKCVFCGMCVEACPMHAITLTLNGKPYNPVIEYGAFPRFQQYTKFDKSKFDFALKDFVIENCSANVISYDKENDTMQVDQAHCIRCRQCEIASDGAFTVMQPWEGTVRLHREKCVEGCFACADICPTRALHINEEGELVLADYYCIKCGACMQICPVKAEWEEYTVELEYQGEKYPRTHKRLVNADELPILVERWRVHHTPVESGAWLDALEKLADEKAAQWEIDRKRALRRRDLIVALKGDRSLREHLLGKRDL